MAPPLEIHFFPFFSYSPNANNDLHKLTIEMKTKKNDWSFKVENPHKNFPSWAGIEVQTSLMESSDGDNYSMPFIVKSAYFEIWTTDIFQVGRGGRAV